MSESREAAAGSRIVRGVGAVLALALALATGVSAQTPVEPPSPAPPIAAVTFDEAVQRAVEKHPTVAGAAQSIVRSQGLLDQSRSVFRPLLTGGIGETMIDAPRGFAGNITQPQRQAAFNATASYSLFDLARW